MGFHHTVSIRVVDVRMSHLSKAHAVLGQLRLDHSVEGIENVSLFHRSEASPVATESEGNLHLNSAHSSPQASPALML